MRAGRMLVIGVNTVLALASFAWCAPLKANSETGSRARSTPRAVYEVHEETVFNELVNDAAAHAYAAHAIDRDGVARAKPDPVLLRFMRERTRAADTAVEPTNETASAK